MFSLCCSVDAPVILLKVWMTVLGFENLNQSCSENGHLSSDWISDRHAVRRSRLNFWERIPLPLSRVVDDIVMKHVWLQKVRHIVCCSLHRRSDAKKSLWLLCSIQLSTNRQLSTSSFQQKEPSPTGINLFAFSKSAATRINNSFFLMRGSYQLL